MASSALWTQVTLYPAAPSSSSAELRKDRTPTWWEGFYREDVANEAGQIERKRKSVNLGLLADLPTKRSAQRKLAAILAEINDADYRPRSTATLSGFVKKYQELKMPTKKGTTQAGYAINRASTTSRFSAICS